MSLENVYVNPQTSGVNQLNTLCKNKTRSTFRGFQKSDRNMADIYEVFETVNYALTNHLRISLLWEIIRLSH